MDTTQFIYTHNTMIEHKVRHVFILMVYANLGNIQKHSCV